MRWLVVVGGIILLIGVSIGVAKGIEAWVNSRSGDSARQAVRETFGVPVEGFLNALANGDIATLRENWATTCTSEQIDQAERTARALAPPSGRFEIDLDLNAITMGTLSDGRVNVDFSNSLRVSGPSAARRPIVAGAPVILVVEEEELKVSNCGAAFLETR